jgi:DNA invertase Pin-like site-specific DNA recombinase
MKIDDFLEISISSRKTDKERRIDELVEHLQPSDTLIVTELSRLGRSTASVIALINNLIAKSIRVIIIKQGLDMAQHDMNSKIIITLFSLLPSLNVI